MHKNDPDVSFDGVIVEYAKVVEMQLRNKLIEVSPELATRALTFGIVLDYIRIEGKNMGEYYKSITDYQKVARLCNRNVAAHEINESRSAVEQIRNLLYNQKMLHWLK